MQDTLGELQLRIWLEGASSEAVTAGGRGRGLGVGR